jgi:hypothetical protein
MDHTRCYRICGRVLRLRCDDADYARRFAAAFRHFRCDEESSLQDACEVFAQTDVEPTQLFARIAFGEASQFPLYDHLVLHGAALEHRGAVTAIVGRTHSGKTTLGLRLALEPGYAFLSDEFCPVRRADGIAEPFPRCVGLRHRTRLLLSGAVPDADPAPQTDVDPAQIRGLSIGRGGPLRNVVVLSGEGVAAVQSDRRLLDVPSVNAALLADLRAVDGVRAVTVLDQPAGFGTTVAIDIVPEARVADRLIHVCRVQHRMGSVSFLPPDACRPDFARPPALAALTPVRGLIETARYLANHRAIQQQIGPGYPRLLDCLAGTLGQARFFTLRPGPLEETCRLLQRDVLAT